MQLCLPCSSQHTTLTSTGRFDTLQLENSALQQEGAKNHSPPCCICIIRVTRKMPGLVGLWVTKQVQMWLSLPLHVETGCYKTPNYKTPYILSLDLHAHSVYMVETVSNSWTCTVFICLAALLSLLTIKYLLSATYHCKKKIFVFAN